MLGPVVVEVESVVQFIATIPNSSLKFLIHKYNHWVFLTDNVCVHTGIRLVETIYMSIQIKANFSKK